MTTTADTFIYLKRDIEQSFQRLQTIYNSSHYNPQEFDQLFHHISCTLDDLQKVNQLLQSSSIRENQSVNIPISDSENENEEEENRKFIPQISIKDQRFTVGYSKQNEEPLLSSNSNSTFDEREDFIRRMKTQFDYYKSKTQSTKGEAQMEIIRLDQAPEEDQLITKQDEQLEDIHHSILSLKNLTHSINFEINDHIRVLDNLETGMVDSQSRVENLTKHTKHFLRTSADGVGGHTCLFATAVLLFLVIVILILFF